MLGSAEQEVASTGPGSSPLQRLEKTNARLQLVNFDLGSNLRYFCRQLLNKDLEKV